MQREWARRGVRAARTDRNEKDKNVRAQNIAASEKMAAKSRATERALERLEIVEKPWVHWELRLHIAEAPRIGEVVASPGRVSLPARGRAGSPPPWGSPGDPRGSYLPPGVELFEEDAGVRDATARCAVLTEDTIRTGPTGC